MKTVKLALIALGFSLNAFAQNNSTIVVRNKKVACDEKKECYQVKVGKATQWTNLEGTIQGFTYVPGNTYTLKVKQNKKTGDYKLKKVVKTVKSAAPVAIEDQKIVLTHLKGKAVEANKVNFLLNSKTSQLSGNSGCNNFNAGYELEGNTLTVLQGMSTMMACPSMDLENEVQAALRISPLTVEKEGSVVKFLDKGNELLRFSIVTKEDELSIFDEKKWNLIMLDNKGQDYNNAFIKLDTKEKKVSGNAGCNNFFGSFTTNGGTITFSPLGSTRMACPNEGVSKIESTILSYLSDKTVTFEVERNMMKFENQEGKVLMVFALDNSK